MINLDRTLKLNTSQKRETYLLLQLLDLGIRSRFFVKAHPSNLPPPPEGKVDISWIFWHGCIYTGCSHHDAMLCCVAIRSSCSHPLCPANLPVSILQAGQAKLLMRQVILGKTSNLDQILSFSAQKFGQMIVDLCEIVKTWKWHKLLPFHLQGTASSMAFLLTSRFPSCSDLANLIFSLETDSTCKQNNVTKIAAAVDASTTVLCHLLGGLKLLMCFSLSRRDMTWAKLTQANTAEKAPNISGNAKKKSNRVGVCRIDSTSKETASHSSAKGPSTALWVSAVQVTPSFSFSRLRLRHRKKYISPVSQRSIESAIFCTHEKCHWNPKVFHKRDCDEVWHRYEGLQNHTDCWQATLFVPSCCCHQQVSAGRLLILWNHLHWETVQSV